MKLFNAIKPEQLLTAKEEWIRKVGKKLMTNPTYEVKGLRPNTIWLRNPIKEFTYEEFKIKLWGNSWDLDKVEYDSQTYDILSITSITFGEFARLLKHINL